MGTFNKGILGAFSGKVGTVVGGTWNGIAYLRSLPTIKSNATPKLSQQVQRLKFSLAASLIHPMKGLVAVTFKDFAKRMSGHNSALSYTLRNAVVGDYPDFELDYSLALVARGGLPNGASAAAVANVQGKVTFTWTDNTGYGNTKATDKAILVVYCPELNDVVYTLTGPSRSDARAEVDVSSYKDKEVHTWISFISANGKDIATSVYTGAHTVPSMV